MYAIVEQKKAELKKAAELHKDEFISGYSDILKSPNSILRLGVLGGGFILKTMLPENEASRENKFGIKEKDTKNKPDGSEEGGYSQFKIEFREKLILVLLEILRQILLMFTEKLIPANDDKDLR